MKARRTECLAAFWQPLELSLLHFKAQKQFFRRTAFLVVFEKVPSKQEDFDWQFKIRTLIMSDQRGLRPPHLRALCVKLCALCGLIKWQEQRKWKRYATVFFWDSKDTSYRLLATNYLRFLRNDKVTVSYSYRIDFITIAIWNSGFILKKVTQSKCLYFILIQFQEINLKGSGAEKP